MGKYIIEKLLAYKIISEENTELYKFGIECLLLKVLYGISYFCIAICLKMLPEAIVIGCVLLPLRRAAGGYHARTRTGCYLFSCCYALLIFLIAKVELCQFLWWGALVMSDIIIFFLSPIDSENKRLEEIEVKYYRRKTRYILLLFNISVILLTAANLYHIGNLLICGICAAALLLLLHTVSKILPIRSINKLVYFICQK